MVFYQLKILLLSDTTFGRGDGVAGFVDQEIEHDSFGFPYLRGRTLKGLISEECDNLISSLSNDQSIWYEAAAKLFGTTGSTLSSMGELHVGDACLPADLREAVASQQRQPNTTLTKADVLSSLTSVRRQTAIDAETGAPETNSLRTTRVVIRETQLTAPLSFESQPDERMEVLLAVGALALRHIGISRNRGRGHVRCTFCDAKGNNLTERLVLKFISKETV